MVITPEGKRSPSSLALSISVDPWIPRHLSGYWSAVGTLRRVLLRVLLSDTNHCAKSNPDL